MELNSKPLPDVDAMSYVASTALIFYRIDQKSDGLSFPFDESAPPSIFVKQHSIRDGVVCEGSPVSKTSLLGICRAVIPSLDTDIEFLPETLLAYSPLTNRMVWWMPAAIRQLYFHPETGVKSGLAPCPPLLFSFQAGKLSVFALKENCRPQRTSEVFHNPFFNGSCMGNVRLPRKASPGNMRKIEDLYFGAEFTAHNEPRLKGTTGTDLWASLVGSGQKKPFPLDCLKKQGTVSGVIGKENYK